MIIFDTNLISELAKQRPDANVLHWFSAQNPPDFCTTAISEAEVYVGIALQPPGRRRSEIETAMLGVLSKLFSDRILPFDSAAARQFASVVVKRRERNLHIDEADGQIAAIARTHAATVATCNVKHFEHTGALFINPWTA